MTSINDMPPKRSRWRSTTTTDLVVLMLMAVVAAVGAIGAAIECLWGNFSDDQTLTVNVDIGPDLTVSAPGGFEPTGVAGRLTGSKGDYAVWSVGQAVGMAAVAAIALVVLLLVNDSRKGEPFTSSSVRRLWVAAGACMVGLVGSFVSSMGEIGSKIDGSLTPSSTISLVWVPVFLIFVALASVFRRGLAMRDEAEYTI
jgi:DUF2975 family protein